MSESLFNIFGDHYTRQAVKNVTRQPLCNIENMGKKLSGGPLKHNEPLKKANESKMSFLANTGKSIKNTQMRSVFTPRPVNVNTIIYSDPKECDSNSEKDKDFYEMEFTKPSYKYDNYQTDLLDYLPLPPEPAVKLDLSPPSTPPPLISQRPVMEFDNSYQDEFYTDDFYVDITEECDLDLPDLY